MHSTLTTTLFVAAGLAAGAVAGVVPTTKAAPVAPAPAVEAELHSHSEGGFETSFDVAVEATSAEAVAGGERLELAVELTSRFDKRSAYQYAYVFTDDAGTPVTKPVKSGLIDVGPRGEAAQVIRTPAGLPDGRYQLHLTAAGSDAGTATAVTVQRFFRVEAGRIAPLTDDEWFSTSAANEGRPL